MADRRGRFQFGPRDRRGLLAGARASQLAIVAASLVASIVVLHSVKGPVRGPASLALVLAAVACVTWPIGGRSLEEWAPVMARFATRAAIGTNREAIGAVGHLRATRPPAVLGDFEIVGCETSMAGTFGVLKDGRHQMATGLLMFGGESFALLGESDRLRRVDGWSSVLASIARDAGPIHRLQWIERTLPDPGEALRSHLERAVSVSGTSEVAATARASYRELIEDCAGCLVHELYLAVTVRTKRQGSRRPTRANEASQPATEALAAELALLDERCRRVGLDVRGLVSEAGLRSAIRRGFDLVPVAHAVDWPWPVGFETTWASTRSDGLWHATFWVAEWPRHDVGSDFLLPLLVGAACRRTISVVMAPIAPHRAVRTAEQARTARVADAELRRRHGFALTARSRREHEAVVRREHELASGHGAFRFSAYVTVSAADREELERSCRSVVHSASLCGLDLRRLYGTQGEAFCCTLPVGRGRD